VIYYYAKQLYLLTVKGIIATGIIIMGKIIAGIMTTEMIMARSNSRHDSGKNSQGKYNRGTNPPLYPFNCPNDYCIKNIIKTNFLINYCIALSGNSIGITQTN
jgi:hypothetical protein